jgi:hypothetical protein
MAANVLRLGVVADFQHKSSIEDELLELLAIEAKK